jgi:hypothetical protein
MYTPEAREERVGKNKQTERVRYAPRWMDGPWAIANGYGCEPVIFRIPRGRYI